MLWKDNRKRRKDGVFVQYLLSVFVAGVCLSWSSTALASCYKDALSVCLGSFQQRKTTCKANYDTLHPTCRPLRVQALAACASAKRQWLCNREKQMTDAVKAQCAQRVKDVRTRCLSGGEEVGSCRPVFARCQRQCIKGCTTCTMRSISRCVAQCKASQRVCLSASRDLGRTCKRKAAKEARFCKRQFTLRSWKRHYRCLSRRLVADLRCQYKAYDQERGCVYKAGDHFRDCSQENNEAYQVCKADAKAKCGR